MFQCTCLSKVSLMSFQFSLYAGCFTYKIVCLCPSLCMVGVLLNKFFMTFSLCDGSYLINFLSLSKVLSNFCLSLSLWYLFYLYNFFSHFLPHFMMAVYFLNACVLSLYVRCFGYEIFRALSLFIVGIYILTKFCVFLSLYVRSVFYFDTVFLSLCI